MPDAHLRPEFYGRAAYFGDLKAYPDNIENDAIVLYDGSLILSSTAT